MYNNKTNSHHAFEKKYDIIVVGGGNAALVSAITAAERGKSVLVIERSPEMDRGGNSKFTRNFRFAHPNNWGAMSGEYSEDEFFNDIISVTHGKADKILAKDLVEHSIDSVKWASDHGVKWQKALSSTLHLSRTNQFILGGGKALLNSYYRLLSKMPNVQVIYDTHVENVIYENNRIEGVVVADPSGQHNVKALSVILASGGYESNLAKLEELWGERAKNFIIRGTKHNSGNMIFSAIEKGAETVGAGADGHMVAVDARAPKYEGGIITRVDSIIFGIVVNKNCKRFFDEGENIWPKRYAVVGRLVSEQPDQIAYAIFDSKSWGMFIPPLYSPYKANTISELSDMLSLDSAELEKTISEYNRGVDSNCKFDISGLDGCGTRGLNPEKSNWARRIDKPPFYAYPLRPGLTFTYLGIKVNERSEVLSTTGKKIEGLYAAGEIMAGNILREGYLGGLGMTIGTMFGMRAGESASQ